MVTHTNPPINNSLSNRPHAARMVSPICRCIPPLRNQTPY